MTINGPAPRRWTLLIMAGLGFAVPACNDRSAEANRVVERWLKCEECVENELEAVRDLGKDAVQPLADALPGPPAESTANVRRQLGQAYVRVRDRGPAPALDSTRYVNHYLGNYRALYQSRAITGLAAIGTPEAIARLEAARDNADDSVVAFQFRSDVRDELDRAIQGRWVSISAGLLRTCGIRNDGKSYCWGNNDHGQLGDGSNTGRRTPTAIANPSGAADGFRFVSIAAGDSGRHTCGVSADKLAFCWGVNNHGQLGDSSADARETPVAVHASSHGPISFVGVTTGGDQTCAWTPDYRAFCWGANEAGQLGVGDSTDQMIPTVVTANLAPAKISGGAVHTCADSLNNVLYCWGSNSQGQQGSAVTPGPPVPTQATTPVRVKALSAGATHTCILAQGTSTIPEGSIYCVGHNADGQLGNGTKTDRNEFEKIVSPLFLEVSAGANHTCAIAARSRGMYCWGGNQFGQLGNDSNSEQLTPAPISSALAFLAVSAGANHTCGITVQGEAYCWGRNADGQLGDNTTTDRLLPVKVVKP